MKINLDYIFKTLEGKKLTQPSQEDIIAALQMQLKNHKVPFPEIPGTIDMTFRGVCCKVLQAVFDDEKGLNEEEKIRRFSLAIDMVKTKGDFEFNNDEITLLRKLINKGYAMLIVGQVAELCKPKSRKQ